MSVDYLTDDEVRALVVHCTAAAHKNAYFTAAALCRAEGLNRGSLSHWLRGNRHTPSLFAGARRFCRTFFGNARPLPARFAAAAAAAAEAANGDDLPPLPPQEEDQPPLPPPPVENAADPPPPPPAENAVADLPPPLPPPDEDADDEDGADDGAKEAAAEPAPAPPGADSELRLCSWNLKNFGGRTRPDRCSNIALFIHSFDVVAVQEVRSSSLREALHVIKYPTMRDFRAVNSAMYGTDARREAQGFYYKPATVRFLGARVADTPDVAALPYKPYVGRFQCVASNAVFTLVNVHIKLGAQSDLETRRAQTRALAALVERLAAAAAEHGTVYVCGDFNLQPSDAGFHALRRLGYTASNWRTPTTVGAAGKVYDTFWYPATCLAVQPHLSRVATFDGSLHRNDADSCAAFRAEVSDHLPVTVVARH